MNSKSLALLCWGRIIWSKICSTGIGPRFVQKYKISQYGYRTEVCTEIGKIIYRSEEIRGGAFSICPTNTTVVRVCFFMTSWVHCLAGWLSKKKQTHTTTTHHSQHKHTHQISPPGRPTIQLILYNKTKHPHLVSQLDVTSCLVLTNIVIFNFSCT